MLRWRTWASASEDRLRARADPPIRSDPHFLRLQRDTVHGKAPLSSMTQGVRRDSGPRRLASEPDLAESMGRTMEPFLELVIQPLLTYHAQFYGAVGTALTSTFDSYPLPAAVTANAVTYGRTLLVFPTLLLLARGHSLLPALMVLLNDFLDFADGVVARWWSKRREAPARHGAVTRGAYPSHRRKRLAAQWGMFVDAILDKAFVIPVWVALIQRDSGASTTTAVLLLTLALLETARHAAAGPAPVASRRSPSRCTAPTSARGRTTPRKARRPRPRAATPPSRATRWGRRSRRSRWSAPPSSSCPSHGTRAARAGSGERREAGSPLTPHLPAASLPALVLLCLAVPLAAESVRRKAVPRRVYASVQLSKAALTAQELQFLHRASASGAWVAHRGGGSCGPPLLTWGTPISLPGTWLSVGIHPKTKSDVRELLASVSVVDEVVEGVPSEVDARWLSDNGFHIAACGFFFANSRAASVNVAQRDGFSNELEDSPNLVRLMPQ